MKIIGIVISLIIFIAFVVLSNQWIMREIKDAASVTSPDTQHQIQVQNVRKDTQSPPRSTLPLVQPSVFRQQVRHLTGQEKADKAGKEIIYEPPMKDVILVQ